MKNKWLRSFLLVAGGSLMAGPLHGAGISYHLLKEIPVGGQMRWDYLTADAAARRLYVAHSDKIEVIDMDKDEVAGAIGDTPGVHGFALAPDLKRGFSSNGEKAGVSVVDLESLKTLSRVATGEKPDAILYEPGTGEVYVCNGIAKSMTIFKAATGEVVATLPLPGKPEFVRTDPEAAFVYGNIEDKNEVVAIDAHTHQIVHTWLVAPGDSPSSMAIDPVSHRLFIGCRNKMLVVMDSGSGRIVASAPIAGSVDATVFDESGKLVFSSCGEGKTIILHEDDPDHYTTVQSLSTAFGARTMAFDPVTRKIYLAAVTPDKPAGKSFKILVYGL